MKTKFVEATNGPQNWGKFMLGRFDADEWGRPSGVSLFGANPDARGIALLRAVGWSPDILLVVDLQTGEGAIFRPGGSAKMDLEKHAVWVCPLFEPFLTWLYTQDLTDLDRLPAHVDLPDAPFALRGHRRQGPAASDAVAASKSRRSDL